MVLGPANPQTSTTLAGVEGRMLLLRRLLSLGKFKVPILHRETWQRGTRESIGGTTRNNTYAIRTPLPYVTVTSRCLLPQRLAYLLLQVSGVTSRDSSQGGASLLPPAAA